MLDALLSILVDSIGSLTFYPFLEKSEAETNLQKIRDGLSKRGAKNIEIKYLHYRRWGIRTYSVSFENQKGITCLTEFMIPKHDIDSIEWTNLPKNML